MKGRILALALIGAAMLPLSAAAQQRSDMELRQPRRPTIVHPPVSKEQSIAAQDAEQLRSEIAARTQAKQLMREAVGFPRRPDLGYDVTSGIQSRRTNGILPR